MKTKFAAAVFAALMAFGTNVYAGACFIDGVKVDSGQGSDVCPTDGDVPDGGDPAYDINYQPYNENTNTFNPVNDVVANGGSVGDVSATGGAGGSATIGDVSATGGAGGTGGTATATAGSVTNNVTVNTPTASAASGSSTRNIKYSGSYKVKNTPSMGAPNIQPTAGCRKPVNGALSAPGIGVSLGTTFLDETCVFYEDIRHAKASGDPETMELADELMRRRLQARLDEQDKEARKETSDRVTTTWRNKSPKDRTAYDNYQMLTDLGG